MGMLQSWAREFPSKTAPLQHGTRTSLSQGVTDSTEGAEKGGGRGRRQGAAGGGRCSRGLKGLRVGNDSRTLATALHSTCKNVQQRCLTVHQRRLAVRQTPGRQNSLCSWHLWFLKRRLGQILDEYGVRRPRRSWMRSGRQRCCRSRATRVSGRTALPTPDQDLITS